MSEFKVSTFCSGIGSPEQALKELGVDFESVFAAEIDKYARQTFLANHKTNLMIKDMTECEYVGDEYYADLNISGLPCQAFSLAGKRLGELDKRGLLFYDFYRYVKNQQPKVFIIENVKGLLSDNNGITFQNWCALLGRSMNTHVNMFNHDDGLLYNLHFKVLNSKDFGVPQNRERVFLVGIRNDLPNTFRFPIGERLTKRLKDILEPEVDEKYYLSDKMIAGLVQHQENSKENGRGFKFEPLNPDIADNAKCLRANSFKMGPDDNYIQEPYCVRMQGRNPENPSDRTKGAPTEQRLEPNSQGITNTIRSVQKDNLIVEPGIKNIGNIYPSGGQNGNIFDENGISPTLSSGTTDNSKNGGIGSNNAPKVLVREATKQGYAIAKEGDSINLSNPNSETRRGRVGDQIANNLDTACNQGVVVSNAELKKVGQLDGFEQSGRIYSDDGLSQTISSQTGGIGRTTGLYTTQQRIRRLTPLECMRLQGYPDSFIKPCSDSQTYKQAGNSITVNVMKAIIKNILPIIR